MSDNGERKEGFFQGFAVVAVVVAMLSITGGVVVTYRATDDINRERAKNTLLNCQDVNRRHDKTIEQLDALIAKVPADRQKRARESRASTVLLINALVPRRDCQALVLKTVTK